MALALAANEGRVTDALQMEANNRQLRQGTLSLLAAQAGKENP